MRRFNRFMGFASALLIGTLLTQGTATAATDPGRSLKDRQSRIVGVWDVEVVVSNCETNATLFTFLAMHSYTAGGTGQVVPATNPANTSAHMMIWRHIAGNTYQMAFKMYRYDANGVAVGWTVVSNEVSINNNATEYVGGGVAEAFDLNGNFQFASCPAFTGARFNG